MKDKPTKWGIKVFVLADATNGYVKRLQIYTGKDVSNSSIQVGLCTKVVLDLVLGLEFSFHLYTDNYYTSPLLYNHLYNRGINACGTARTNRKHSPSTVSNRGMYKYLSNGPLLACAWVDKRSINLLTTLHVAKPPSGIPCTVGRRQVDGSQEDVVCPPCLPDYQTFIRGVDRIDQLGSYYNVGRRRVSGGRGYLLMALNVAWVIVMSWMGMFNLVNMLQRGGVSVIFCSFGTKLPVVSLETFELGNGWDVLVVLSMQMLIAYFLLDTG